MVMRGDRLRQIREARNYTQSELASMLGYGEKEIWRYENGKSIPSADKVADIARVLGVTTDYLLGLSDGLMGTIDDLTEQETEVIEALRSGDKLKAIQAIVGK